MTPDLQSLLLRVEGAAWRFWEKVSRGEPDACWPWAGYRSSRGYGVWRYSKREVIRAHRAAWMFANRADCHKLTEEQVREIRASNLSLAQVKAAYGISTTTASRIRQGRIWKHVRPDQTPSPSGSGYQRGEGASRGSDEHLSASGGPTPSGSQHTETQKKDA